MRTKCQIIICNIKKHCKITSCGYILRGLIVTFIEISFYETILFQTAYNNLLFQELRNFRQPTQMDPKIFVQFSFIQWLGLLYMQSSRNMSGM